VAELGVVDYSAEQLQLLDATSPALVGANQLDASTSLCISADLRAYAKDHGLRLLSHHDRGGERGSGIKRVWDGI
jgi:hypothetical protein